MMLFAIAISLLYVEIKSSVFKKVFAGILKIFWSEWELRLMVIVSLILQFLLVYFGNKRKKYTGRCVPAIAISAWLIYLSADWMATLVLSTLLRGLENEIIIFWTPFLLWHLGSPYNITAYSLEDNELWLRHFLGMVFQIGEAIYIYIRFRSKTELTVMALPLFIGGVIKYVERIWALRCASPKQLINFFYQTSTSKCPKEGTVINNKKEMIRTGLFDLSKKTCIEDPGITPEVKFLREVHSSFDVFKPLFADFPFQISKKFHDDMVYLKPWTRTAVEAFNFVGIELEFLYDLHYTKNPIQHRNYRVSLILRSICFFCVVSVLISFSALYHKMEHFTVDIFMTYLLLLGAVYLEISSFGMHIRSKWTMLRYTIRRGNKVQKLYHGLVHNRLRSTESREGIKKMAQHDLIDYYVKAKASSFTPVIKLIDTRNLLQKFGHTKWKPVDFQLKDFIYCHLKEKRSKFQKEGFKLEYLNRLLGEQGDNVIQEKCLEYEDWEMESTDFTRRIFVWHIATSLVYYDDLDKHRRNTCDTIHGIGKSLSDYMMYLVLVCPSMLPNGFSEMVNKETYLETQRFSPHTNTKKHLKLSTKEFAEALLDLQSASDFVCSQSSHQTEALWDGLKFAKKLQILAREFRWDHEEKWKMISDVWMEMMVYGASRCTWEVHAQQLEHGGELLTHVSLLMAHLGLSTQVRRLETSHDDDVSSFPQPV